MWWDEALASTDLSSPPLSKSESPVQGSVRKFPHSVESEIDLRLGRQSILKRPSTQRSAQFLRGCSKCRISSAINSAHSSVAEGFSAIPRAQSNRTWCLWIEQELRYRGKSESASSPTTTAGIHSIQRADQPLSTLWVICNQPTNSWCHSFQLKQHWARDFAPVKPLRKDPQTEPPRAAVPALIRYVAGIDQAGPTRRHP